MESLSGACHDNGPARGTSVFVRCISVMWIVIFAAAAEIERRLLAVSN